MGFGCCFFVCFVVVCFATSHDNNKNPKNNNKTLTNPQTNIRFMVGHINRPRRRIFSHTRAYALHSRLHTRMFTFMRTKRAHTRTEWTAFSPPVVRQPDYIIASIFAYRAYHHRSSAAVDPL